MKKIIISCCLMIVGFSACTQTKPTEKSPAPKETSNSTTLEVAIPEVIEKVEKTPEEWRQQLGDKAYKVLREEGTEYAFSGAYWNNHEKGIYYCAGCGLPLFNSETKFESGTGWPSFWSSLSKTCVKENIDNSHGMSRTEVECARCGGHLGHVFDDGPEPTGLRYCINSVSLKFEKQ